MQLVANLGFPAIVTMYLLVRIEGKLESLSIGINSLNSNISELNNATTALMNGITKGVATDNNGNEVPYIIDLNTGKISKISASEAQQVDKTIKGVNDKADTINKVLNLNDILDKYAQKGFKPVDKPEQKTINGQTVLIGTLINSNGEEVKINLKTGEEIKE